MVSSYVSLYKWLDKLTIEVSQREPHVCLREAQSDALVFELFGKLLQVFCSQILLKM